MSLTYDGFDLTRYATVRIGRPVAPSMRTVTEDVPGRAGDVLLAAELDTVQFVAHCTLLRKYLFDWPHVRMELAKAFSKPGAHVLTLPDEPGLWRMASASFSDDDIETPLEPPVTFDVAFICHDPYAYGDVRKVTVQANVGATLSVNGIMPAYLTVSATSVRPSSSGVWGVRFDGQDFVHVPISVSPSSVEVNGEARTCRVNGATAMITFDSHWPRLEPGEHQVIVDQGSGNATISWQEVWL